MSSRLVSSNALFLHIPKTGGTWVEQALMEIGVHTEQPLTIPGVTYRHSLLPMFQEQHPYVFTFVRHPLSWYESWWKFQAGTWTIFEPGVWHPQRTLESCRADDFSEFIRLCIEHEPSYVSRMYEWYIGPVGFEFVNYVGRYENLINDLVQVLTVLDQTFDVEILRKLDPINVSRKTCGEPVWDPALKRQMLALEAPAIRRFYPEWIDPSCTPRECPTSTVGLKSLARRVFARSRNNDLACNSTR
jgi:Sulfotransferase family